MTEPLLNWGYFLGFLGVVLAVIYGYWQLLDWLFDVAKARQQKADRALEKLQADMRAIKELDERRKVLNAAISWKVKPR